MSDTEKNWYYATENSETMVGPFESWQEAVLEATQDEARAYFQWRMYLIREQISIGFDREIKFLNRKDYLEIGNKIG